MNILLKAADWYKKSFLTRFISNAVGLYLCWFLFYETSNPLSSWMDEAMLDHLTSISKGILVLMGYEIFELPGNIYGIKDSSGIMIGAPCNGISLMALFSGFIIAFPSTLKQKTKVLLIGLATIHVMNLIRIVALVMLAYYHREWLEFNHDYTFTLIVYAVTFLIWIWWVNRLPKQKQD